MAKAPQFANHALWKGEDISAPAIKGRVVELLNEGQARTSRAASFAKQKSWELASDCRMQVTAASGIGGAVTVGTGGAGLGLVAGGMAGAAVGILPALFTLGLSIPVGAAIGGGCGLAFGGAVGGTVGFTGASAIGYSAYTKRAEIRSLVNTLKAKALAYGASARAKTAETCTVVATTVRGRVATFVGLARERTIKAVQATRAMTAKIVSDKDVQAATASTFGGLVVLGAGGGATGLATGTAVGAVVGLVPAMFTFGLSIPCFAVVGGGCGLAAGTAVGGTTGAAAGFGGYCAYTRRETIRDSFGVLAKKVRASTRAAHSRHPWTAFGVASQQRLKQHSKCE